jgi:hypothetical protein
MCLLTQLLLAHNFINHLTQLPLSLWRKNVQVQIDLLILIVRQIALKETKNFVKIVIIKQIDLFLQRLFLLLVQSF